ncbi:MAG: cupin domain-containing protein [Bryobacteraceae bacterium]|nr:cupin domain-containing protein [Bryobacterales bacterium]MEB2361727.1 cupin domain-containing protein [Bryobacterales bacterium]NUN03850.1 cupin domain-containing protein [Bryobacteraceae bacterium]
MHRYWLVCGVAAILSPAAERQVDPTWLRRQATEVPAVRTGAPGVKYRALFGEGAQGARILRGVVRYGEMILEPGASTMESTLAGEEQAHVVLEGSGIIHYKGSEHPLRVNDFYYIAPGSRHQIRNDSKRQLRIVVMGFRTKDDPALPAPEPLQIANISDVPLQVVGGHPPSTKYRLLMGDRRSIRDRIAAGEVLTSLFIMEFEPGGTNFPHHHETEEEIYLVLEGSGDMVAGGGADGVEGRHPAKANDAYAFRLNCTVGFYNAGPPNRAKARILAVRSLFPSRRR